MKMDLEATANIETAGNVVDLSAFRKKKVVQDELARGRKPLFVSHMDGKVTGSPHLNRPSGQQPQDFGDRIQRIRSSLQKINQLMAELKRMSTEQRSAE